MRDSFSDLDEDFSIFDGETFFHDTRRSLSPREKRDKAIVSGISSFFFSFETKSFRVSISF